MDRMETKMQAPPMPANARPKMSTLMLGATPQMRLPTSKMMMARRKADFSGKYLYALPPVGWVS